MDKSKLKVNDKVIIKLNGGIRRVTIFSIVGSEVTCYSKRLGKLIASFSDIESMQIPRVKKVRLSTRNSELDGELSYDPKFYRSPYNFWDFGYNAITGHAPNKPSGELTISRDRYWLDFSQI